jgi:hypothetical protein
MAVKQIRGINTGDEDTGGDGVPFVLVHGQPF